MQDNITSLIHANLKTTRIGFGCSRLHYLPTKERQPLLARAFELGIRHFDTAPSYGHGLSEIELGRFLRDRRDDCVIVTKFGIPPSAWLEGCIRRYGKMARAAIAVRATMRRAGLVAGSLPELTADQLERSIHESLRRLRTDYIDIHLLHEPTLQRIPNLSSLIEKYYSLKAQGLVRAFGLAGAYSDCSSIWTAAGCPDLVVQTAEADWDPCLLPDITYGIMGGISQKFAVHSTVADCRLRSALLRREAGVVLLSTTRLQHLEELILIANQVFAGL